MLQVNTTHYTLNIIKMKIVIIDNYDSFTYNLAHLVKELGADVTEIGRAHV